MSVRRALFICLPLFIAAVSGRAAAPVDLGQGLSYVRVHAFAADEAALTGALAANTALVIDLRYTTAEKENGNAFYGALAKHNGAAPLFVLVSPATPAPLAEALSASSIKFISLGIKGSLPNAQVVVKQPADTDRRAYDALESGLPLAALLSGKIEKNRYDEASLMKDFRNGNLDAEPPPGPDPSKKDDDGTLKAPVLTDRVLQRAVHLHAALQAIKAR
ncbi:MAG TPA: hypothetical protein VFJ90_06170 [Candidatus Didemnitutus sp.]|nr:hypothetical protein [Candidatus Didemnitutus sp.]